MYIQMSKSGYNYRTDFQDRLHSPFASFADHRTRGSGEFHKQFLTLPHLLTILTLHAKILLNGLTNIGNNIRRGKFSLTSSVFLDLITAHVSVEHIKIAISRSVFQHFGACPFLNWPEECSRKPHILQYLNTNSTNIGDSV